MVKMDKVISNKNRANKLRFFFYALILIDVISIVSNYMQLQLLNLMDSGVEISDEELTYNDTRQAVVSIFSSLFIIGSIITFMMWFARAYYNLHRLNVNGLQFSKGWSIGGWFVPFLNLVRPYNIMKEIWNETQNYIFKKDDFWNFSSTKIISWWWAIWLISNFLSNVSAKLELEAESLNSYIISSKAVIFTDLFDIIATVITLVMVNKMVIFEDRMFEISKEDVSSISI